MKNQLLRVVYAILAMISTVSNAMPPNASPAKNTITALVSLNVFPVQLTVSTVLTQTLA